MSAVAAFQNAVVEALKADLATAALVGARVYDEVPRDDRNQPSDAAAPFIYCGVMTWRDVENSCGPLFDVSLRLYIVSTAFGRAEARAIGEAARAALNRRELALAGGHEMIGHVTPSAGGDVQSSEQPHEYFLDLRARVADANGYDGPV